MQIPDRPPSYSQSHDPQSRMHVSPVPNMVNKMEAHHDRTPPPLGGSSEPSSRPADAVEQTQPPTPWLSSNPLTAYYQPTPSHPSPIQKATTVTDSPSAMDVDGDRSRRAGSVLSMDDPDVRLAAEALGDLRAGKIFEKEKYSRAFRVINTMTDFISSPPQQHSSLPPSSNFQQGGRTSSQQPEPLLSLLTTSHPLIGTAIGGSINAYSASKNYSPRFKSGAEYVEKRFTPVVNTVGSVGRVTGVEGGVRWFLGGRRPSHNHDNDDQGSHKRRKVGDTDMDMDHNVSRDPYPVYRQEYQLHHRQRRPSQGSTVESLPPYDEHRSPSYEQALVTTQHSDSPTSPNSTWQSRLILSTSGLSVAMSDESLRSLKYCLGWLRWANEHIGKVIDALKSVLEHFDGAASTHPNGSLTNGDYKNGVPNGQLVVRTESDRTAMNERIAELKSDVLKTLKDVVDVVSKYTGSALPENARTLVRRHLTSLPQRFMLASTNTSQNRQVPAGGDGEVREGARKVMVLAREGLDMMAQVSGVLDGTIMSAEEWCERLGRKKWSEAAEAQAAVAQAAEDNGMMKQPLSYDDKEEPAPRHAGEHERNFELP